LKLVAVKNDLTTFNCNYLIKSCARLFNYIYSVDVSKNFKAALSAEHKVSFLHIKLSEITLLLAAYTSLIDTGVWKLKHLQERALCPI
jgi:hypothetical protein